MSWLLPLGYKEDGAQAQQPSEVELVRVHDHRPVERSTNAQKECVEDQFEKQSVGQVGILFV